MSSEFYGFKNKEIRCTDDIEVLRDKYEELLKAYEKEIKSSVLMSLKLENVNT